MSGILINWTPGQTLEILEKQAILAAFQFYRGNKTQTSQSLGISIRTLDTKLGEYKINFDEEKDADYERRKEREQFLARSRGDRTPNYLTTGHKLNVEAERPESEKRSQDVSRAAAGARVESAAVPAAQQPVPVSERKEVQSVSPGQASMGGARRHR